MYLIAIKAYYIAMINTISKELRALAVTFVAAVLGTAYFILLNAASFPPDAVRIIPVIWIAGAGFGLILAIRIVHANLKSYFAWTSIMLGIPSLLLALVFALSAVIGD